MNGFVAILRKEMTQMLRDRGTLIFAFIVPVFELILFGVIDMNAKHIPTVVFDQSNSQESRLLIDQFKNTSYMDVIGYVQSRAGFAAVRRAYPSLRFGQDERGDQGL